MNETTEDKLRDATAHSYCCSTEEIMTKHFLLHFITAQNEAPRSWWCTNIATTCFSLFIPDESSLINFKVKERIWANRKLQSSGCGRESELFQMRVVRLFSIYLLPRSCISVPFSYLVTLQWLTRFLKPSLALVNCLLLLTCIIRVKWAGVACTVSQETRYAFLHELANRNKNVSLSISHPQRDHHHHHRIEMN